MASLIYPAPSDPLSTTPTWTVGLDEVGRGCLAGPVMAAAVVLHGPLEGLNDSKKLSAAQRGRIRPLIEAQARAWAVGEASVADIDRINILQATFLAMERALDAVLAQLPPDATGELWVDGNQTPPFVRPGWTWVTIVGGDASHGPISAASIVAKEHRDALMDTLDVAFPGYGLGKHKGYGTAQHLQALDRLGVSPHHRRTFKPVTLRLAASAPTVLPDA